MGFVSVLSFAHYLIKQRVQPGDRVIDATIGNGHDTLFLADLVGDRGFVYGFDIQEQARKHTTERLVEAGHDLDRIRLVLDSHENMLQHVPVSDHGQIAAIMFNLGYLPGADKSVITQPDSTLSALDSALELLRPQGIVTMVLYPGHDGGDIEAMAVENHTRQLPQSAAQVLCYRFLNNHPRAPYLIAIEKK